MKDVSTQTKQRKNHWTLLKKLWQCIWNSGGSIQDCPKQGRSAQDIRDDYAEKCPWKGDLF